MPLAAKWRLRALSILLISLGAPAPAGAAPAGCPAFELERALSASEARAALHMAVELREALPFPPRDSFWSDALHDLLRDVDAWSVLIKRDDRTIFSASPISPIVMGELNFATSAKNASLTRVFSEARDQARRYLRWLARPSDFRDRLKTLEAKPFAELQRADEAPADADGLEERWLWLCAEGSREWQKHGYGQTESIDFVAISERDQITKILKKLEMRSRPGLVLGAVIGALDPYSVYYSPRQLSEKRALEAAQSLGLGIEPAITPTGILIKRVRPGSGAEESGLRKGDWIVSVDGADARSLDESALRQSVANAATRGAIPLVVRSGAVETTVHVSIHEIPSEAVSPARIERVLMDGRERAIGYVKLNRFDPKMADDLIARMAPLLALGIEGLLVDLRGNPGGRLEEARSAFNDLTAARAKWSLPIVALVDENSASSAEFLAGSLQDSQTALIVGRMTYGKGTYSILKDLPDGGAIRLTEDYYRLPSGRSPHLEGVSPDVSLGIATASPRERDNPYALPAPAANPPDPNAPPRAASFQDAIRAVVEWRADRKDAPEGEDPDLAATLAIAAKWISLKP